MRCGGYIGRVLRIALRECERLRSNSVYLLCMVVFPLFVTLFFTSLMGEGQPQDMPIGAVDLDNTATTHKLIRTLDSFQNTKVAFRYPDFNSARQAMQRNEIYGFIYFPAGTTDKLLSSRQPKISFYYSYASLTAGSLVFKDLKTAASLGSAGVGSAVMSAKGYTADQVRTFLQPVTVDLHPISNPWVNYNIYLSTTIVPGCLFLFVFLITAYSLGTELKMGTARKLFAASGGNMAVALTGKFLPLFFVHLMVFYGYMFYVFGVLGFPHPGGVAPVLLLGLLSVAAAQGFGIFIFGIYPSLRMSMSVCSLLAVLGFSLVGTAFPTFSMDVALEVLANMFPLRHFFLVYQISILNGFPLSDVWPNIAALGIFSLLPLLVLSRMRRVMYEYVYIP